MKTNSIQSGLTLVVAMALAMTSCEKRGGGSSSQSAPKATLLMLCAAGMRAPVEKVAKQYQEEYGVEVQLQFGGSGTLLGNLEVAPCDLFLAADESYTKLAKQKDLVAETMAVAQMRGGFGVPKGNPKGVKALADVKREDLRIGIGNPEAASIGKFSQQILEKNGLWEGFQPAATFPTVNEIANAVKVGSIDAAILWDAVAHQYPEMDFVRLPEFDAAVQHITVGVAAKTKLPTEALRFCRYLTARDKGLPVFADLGYEVSDGDAWAEEPEILLFSGAMLRPAIEKTIERFEAREGVRVTPVYNGCGILVSQMKAGEKPDAYFSCDVKFMEMVKDRFFDGPVVSANEMVILVAKGNPKGIATLQDLVKPGLRIGLGDPEKSALGFLTKALLDGEGLSQTVADSGNLKLNSATGDLLVNQLKAGSLDAVIVYKSNAMAAKSTADDCDILGIQRPNAVAEQPYAVARESAHKHLLERFFEACVSEEGKKAFLDHGFRWELKENPQPAQP
ncbi:MAG: molybdate ABC transporter substrate-binding protein [Verrucomicrobiae bacterium]|nr:molybdate ABC transporter substrate-binding protein [Verrucomicrobiae bacterium]